MQFMGSAATISRGGMGAATASLRAGAILGGLAGTRASLMYRFETAVSGAVRWCPQPLVAMPKPRTIAAETRNFALCRTRDDIATMIAPRMVHCALFAEHDLCQAGRHATIAGVHQIDDWRRGISMLARIALAGSGTRPGEPGPATPRRASEGGARRFGYR